MAQDIKRKIVLEGEKEYSAALKEAQRNLKTLRSELKAETAEMGANATAQQKNEARAKSLQKQIKEQEKVVKTLQAALAEAKENYGDNEEVVAKWEQKLNDARASLANMKNSLTETSQAVKENGDSFREAADGAAATVTATKSAADALGMLGDAGENVAGAIENVFFGMIDTIESAVSAMWDLVTETAAKVNGWEDIAGYWNTDTQTIQQYARAVAASGNAFEDLNSAVSKLVLGGKGDKITEMLGISHVNYKNDWDYAMAVMDQIYTMRERGQDMIPIFETIFGEKKSTKVMDLLDDWGTIKGLLDTFNGDNGGFGMTSDALSSMAALHVQVSTVEEKWDALKANFAAGLGTATGELLVNVEGSLDALNDFMNAKTPEEREKALENLRTNVEEFFKKVADILREGIAILNEVGHELQESDDPLTALIGDILVKLTDALQWMVDNQDAVEAAFYSIFALCLMGHLAKAGTKLAEVIAQIETIKKFKGVDMGGAAAGAAGAAGAASAAGAEGAAATAAAAEATTTAGTPVSGFMKSMSTLALFNIAKGASERLGTGLYGEWYKRNNYEEAKKSGAIRELAYTKDGWVDVYKWEKAHPGEELERLPLPEIKKEEEPLKRSGHSGSFGEDEEDALKEQERIQQASGPKRKKNIIGTATEEQMQTRPPEQTAEEAVTEAMQTVAVAVPETMEGLLDALYEHINGYDPETNQLNTTDFFDQVLYPMIQKAAELGGVTGDDADAIADLIYDKWIQSMYDEEWEGSTSGILNILEEAIEEAAAAPTEAQKDAAEEFWDLYRETGDLGDERFDALEEQFEGADELFDKLMEAVGKLYDSTQGDEWRGIEDLPANWWMDAEAWMRTGSENNGITSGDLANFRSLPGSVAAAVKSGAAQGVSGIKVYLDGVEVGRLVAPYVSETIARDVIM